MLRFLRVPHVLQTLTATKVKPPPTWNLARDGGTPMDCASISPHGRALIPKPEGQSHFFHAIAAARTPAGIFPGFHEMFRFDRTRRLEFLPDQTAFAGCFPQNHRRNLRPEKSGKPGLFAAIGFRPPQSGEDIV